MSKKSNLITALALMATGLGVVSWLQKRAAERAWGNEAGAALVTGASSGIGTAFARRLAAEGYDLVLVARRVERLEALAAELRQLFHVDVEVLPADLADPAGVERVAQRIAGLDRLALLVHSAGFGAVGYFAETELCKNLNEVRVHDLAAMSLTYAALPGMKARRRGGIIYLSSVASFAPLPGNVTYSASKAFLNVFAQALQGELYGTGVRVQALCPGFTHTGFHSTPEFEGRDVRTEIPTALWMEPEEVVEASLAALRRNEVIFIPGRKNQFLALLGKIGLAAWGGRALNRLFRARVRRAPDS